MGTWNIRTMTPGFNGKDLSKTSELRKSFTIDKELCRLKVDIAALQETRLAESGSVKENNYTFYWQGLAESERRLYGVGFAVRNKLLNKITTPKAKSERIISLQLTTKTGTAHVISAYAPTLDAECEKKDMFYEDLQTVLNEIPASDQIILLGDFNARVGADFNSWPTCIGKFGIGKMNENGQRLLEFCTNNELSITNTFYDGKYCHKVSWRHPRSGHWHLLDYIIVKKKDLNSIKATRAYRSAHCNTDHLFILAKTKVTTKTIHRGKKPKIPKITVRNTKSETLQEKFQAEFSKRCKEVVDEHPDKMWDALRTGIVESATEAFGTGTSSKHDWLEENFTILEPLLEEKREALISYNKNPSQSKLDRLKSAKSKLQREIRRCANSYWEDLCKEIQSAADTGNIRRMYEKIRVALGPQVNKVAPLKSTTGEEITDKNKQMDRWIEHYSSLYSKERDVCPTLENEIPQLPVMCELDDEPSIEELREAIEDLSIGKSTGSDNIPAEILKYNRDTITPHLHQLLLACWKHKEIPQNMRDANIITLYKNKGDKGDCNNYRGISLLSITGKAFARIILKRLHVLAARVLPESQSGFRSGRSTIDMIFALRQVQEKCQEQNVPLHIAFVDLTKAFDTVSRSGLYMVLEKIGCPPTLLQLIISFHNNMKATVQFDGSTSDSFDINSGVKQGCVLAPTLFSIYFAVLLENAFKTSPGDVYLKWRTDGSLFNLSRLKASTKTTTSKIRDLLFADDAAIVAHNESTLQSMMNQLSTACTKFSLVISVKKTVVLSQTQDKSSPTTILLNNSPLEQVNKFCYLGSTVTSSLSLDEEIGARIGKAATNFGKLMKRAWNNKMLTIKTKMHIYNACILSSLLYGSETWTTYSKQEKRLNTFHLRCLRKILGIKWQDKITNVEVLQQAGSMSISSILCKRRLRWLGHVHRMDDQRLPKQLLYSELTSGSRNRGRPKLRYKDTCKRDLKRCNINHSTWNQLAGNRSSWKTTVRAGVEHLEEQLTNRANEKRRRRKDRVVPTSNPASTTACLTCKFCNRVCRSNIGRISHERSCYRTAT